MNRENISYLTVEKTAQHAIKPTIKPTSLDGACVLLVEDAGLVAMEAQAVLEEAGLRVLGPAYRVAQALRLAETEAIDMAFLDIDLNGEHVWPVAEVLAKRKIPFAFTTGFESAAIVPKSLSGSPMLSKPYREQELVRMAEKLLMQI